MADGIVAAVAVGEKAGALDATLARLAEQTRGRYVVAVDRLGEWTPRLLYALICLFVIWNIWRMALNVYGPGGIYDEWLPK